MIFLAVGTDTPAERIRSRKSPTLLAVILIPHLKEVRGAAIAELFEFLATIACCDAALDGQPVGSRNPGAIAVFHVEHRELQNRIPERHYELAAEAGL
jgi:hypothetical protein